MTTLRQILEFLDRLRVNNNREWFNANKAEYLARQAEFNGIVERLIAGLQSLDPALGMLSVRDCTYRIYRDTRFSPDKTPYKTHMSAYICPHGRKSGYAGYYLHIEPVGDGLLGRSILASGAHCPEPKPLLSMREEILDNGAEFHRCVTEAEGWILDCERALKRVPKGFPAESPWADYFKLKDYILERDLGGEVLDAADPVPVLLEMFAPTVNLNRLLNRAIEYAYTEM